MVSEQGNVFLCERKDFLQEGRRVQAEGEGGIVVVKTGDFITVMQRMTVEGEKTCSNLEQGVLNWFQRREIEGCQKTK